MKAGMHASRRLNRSTSELLKLRGDVALLRRQLNSHDSIRGDKTLSEWLQDFDKKRMDLSPQAQNAIRQMGASAIPELLSLLRSSSKASGDNPGAWVITCAFRALGAKAKLAVPDLIELRQPSEPEWIRTQAAASLGFIGPDASSHSRAHRCPGR